MMRRNFDRLVLPIFRQSRDAVVDCLVTLVPQRHATVYGAFVLRLRDLATEALCHTHLALAVLQLPLPWSQTHTQLAVEL
jgi:hypothetical protein